MEDLHGMLRNLERRIAALEAHPALRPAPDAQIRNMSHDGPKPSPAPVEESESDSELE